MMTMMMVMTMVMMMVMMMVMTMMARSSSCGVVMGQHWQRRKTL